MASPGPRTKSEVPSIKPCEHAKHASASRATEGGESTETCEAGLPASRPGSIVSQLRWLTVCLDLRYQVWTHPAYEACVAGRVPAPAAVGGTRRYQINKGEAESRAVTSSIRPARPMGGLACHLPSHLTHEPPKAASPGAGRRRRHAPAPSSEGEAESRAVTST